MGVLRVNLIHKLLSELVGLKPVCPGMLSLVNSPWLLWYSWTILSYKSRMGQYLFYARHDLNARSHF